MFILQWLWDTQVILLLSCMFFTGAIGAVIGSKKGRAFIGFLLGALFGPLGWALALCPSDQRQKCPECKAPVNPGASRCCHCGSEIRKPSHVPSTLKCPYCSTLILAKSIKPGDNACPHCREVFSVE